MSAGIRTLPLAKGSLLLLVLSLPLMKVGAIVFGYWATLTDVLFLLTCGLWALAILQGQSKVRWHRFMIVLAIYLAAIAVSVLASTDPRHSLIKLVTQIYLVGLPVIAFGLIDSASELRRLLVAWLGAATIPALVGAGAVLLFYAGADRSLLDGPLHEYGLLPPGPYPRVDATFWFPSMLCTYLTASVFILFAADRRGWVNRRISAVLLGLITGTAIFTFTPGLGGFALALAICAYLARGGRSWAALLTGAAVASAASIAVSTFTPILHPTAPYLVTLPALDVELAPAVRLLTWTAASQVFIAHPLLGAGIGTAGLAVEFLDPSGQPHLLTDAHNIYLNIAAQCGVVGLGALLLLIWRVAAMTRNFIRSGNATLPLLLGFAWLDSFAVQGFIGSFEDARHLWLLLGLWLASTRFEESSDGSQPTSRA